MKNLNLIALSLFLSLGTLFGQSKFEIPPKQFTGMWVVEKAFSIAPETSEQQEVEVKTPNLEYSFKKGKKQALYRYFADPKRSEYGITILEVSKTKLIFRSWSAHPKNMTVITLKEDGTAVVEEIYAKGGRVFHLRRSVNPVTAEKEPQSEPDLTPAR